MEQHRLFLEMLHVGNGVAESHTCDPAPDLLGELTDKTLLRRLAELHTAAGQPPALMRIRTGQSADEQE